MEEVEDVEEVESLRRRLRAFLTAHHPGRVARAERLAAARRFRGPLGRWWLRRARVAEALRRHGA
ncbi:MAG: hypothetical protein ACREQY_16800, partial [Candidatus Binatia bacterium]